MSFEKKVTCQVTKGDMSCDRGVNEKGDMSGVDERSCVQHCVPLNEVIYHNRIKILTSRKMLVIEWIFWTYSGRGEGGQVLFTDFTTHPPPPQMKLKKVPRYFSKFSLETPTPSFLNKKFPFTFQILLKKPPPGCEYKNQAVIESW